jgi:chromosomal replication initiator protein
MADMDYEGVWNETLVQLRNDLREEEFSGWLSDLKYLRAEENSVIVGIPTAFHRDKVKTHYQSTLNSKLKELSGKDIIAEFEITGKSAKKDTPAHAETQGKAEGSAVPAPSAADETAKPKKKRDKHPQMNEDFTFDKFVKGKNNDFAYNAALAVSKNSGKVYNPLFIFGNTGMGKTHLMQAIGNQVHENTDNKVVYVTAEDFLNGYVDGIAQGKMNSFKNKFRNADVLLIDDIQELKGKSGVQDELFHTFNALINANKAIIFTSDRPPSELQRFHERLLSRFIQGTKVDIQPPGYEERCAILKTAIKNRKADIPDEIIDFVSKNIYSNVRDLIGALNTLIAYTELTEKALTLEIVQERLNDQINEQRQPYLSMDSIIKAVAEYFHLTPNDLKGKKRSQNIVYPRQIAMYIGKEMTEYSTTELGQEFGGRDHTTVMHSIEKIKAKRITDPSLVKTIDSIVRLVNELSAKH